MPTAREQSISPPPSKRRKISTPPLPRPLHNDTLTVYSWNVNGISLFIQRPITSFFKADQRTPKDPEPDPISLRQVLRRYSWPTILCLQEIKINPVDTATQRAVEAAVRRNDKDPSAEADDPDYLAFFCLPSDKYNARGFGGKVYGVCSIVRADFAGEWMMATRHVDWDREGRVLVTETRAGEGRPKLAVINVYAVNGTENPYKDSETGRVVGTRHDRKLRFHDLLAEEVRGLEREGFGVVIAGDVNIARARIDGHPNLRTFPHQHCVNRAHFEARFLSKETVPPEFDADTVESANAQKPQSAKAGLGMVDSFRHLHPTIKAYTYYPRTKEFGASCDRVDMILASASITEQLEAAGMHETAADRGPSDHVPLYASFRFGDVDAGGSPLG